MSITWDVKWCPVSNLHLSPGDNTALFIEKKTQKDNLRDNKSKAPSMIDWLIDYIVFYAVSAIFRIYNGVVKKERKLKGTKVLKNSTGMNIL